MHTLESKVAEVTVFTDRAQVVRCATVRLLAGEQIVLFDKLPFDIDENSIQVNGVGNAVLRDVTFKKEYFSKIQDESVNDFFNSRKDLEDALQKLNDKISNANQELQFIDNITRKITSEASETTTLELDPEKWLKMVNYYRAKLDQINNEIRETEKSKRLITDELQKVILQMKKHESQKHKMHNQVKVIVDMQQQGELQLFLSYIVSGPGWYPVYDLRVSTATKKLNLCYHAMIKQNTTEVWDDTVIKLSTAKPQIAGQQPELEPWFVDVFKPVLPPPVPRSLSRKEASGDEEMKQMFEPAAEMAAAVAIEDVMFGAVEESMVRPDATVATGSTSVVFMVAGNNTINNDNEPHKLAILIEDFAAHFRYSTVPKLAPFAYLKAEVTNNTEFPLLPGETNVFLDNNFVARSSLNLVAPTEKFWTYLGVDESMKVEYKFLKKYQKQEGMISKKNKIFYEYKLIVNNNKKTTEEVVLWDQIPISQNENIIVELLKPKYEKDTDTLKKNEFNYLEWFFTLESGKNREIDFIFSVEYPKDVVVEGL